MYITLIAMLLTHVLTILVEYSWRGMRENWDASIGMIDPGIWAR